MGFTRMAALAATLVMTLSAGTALAAGDPAKGKKVFNKCKTCHSLEAGKNKIGPSLAGMFGREAASAAGFKKYSAALKKSGIVWNDDTIASFLASPKKAVPGNKMSFPGVKKEADLENLIAYLKTATK